MEIERVNDSTIKFFITYKDIEARGFERDEIWYNRERSEELFFEMMNEAQDLEQFELEGPLWIQVQAMDKGLEVVVTRGKISNGNVRLEIPMSKQDKSIELPLDETIADMLGQHFTPPDDEEESEELMELMELIIGFDDFEDLISLSHSLRVNDFENAVYFFEGKYYLHVVFNDEQYTEDEQDNILSHMLEYGYESEVTIYRLQEYGKLILSDNALATFKNTFTLR